MAVDRNAADKLRLRRNAQREAVDHGGTNLTYKGTWSAVTTYHKKDVVSLDGSSYVAVATSLNQTPPNATYWALLSSKGDDGTSFVWRGTWNDPVVFASDDFNRANSSTSLGTATTGEVWSSDKGTWGIISNKAYCPVPTLEAGANSSATVDSGISDGTVTVTISTASTGNGLVARADASNPGDKHVLVYSDGVNITVFEKVGLVSYSQLATFPSTINYTPANGDTLSLLMIGSSMEISVNGVLKGTFTSLLYNTNTRHGLYADNSTVRYDNFSVARPVGTYTPNEVVAYLGSSYINILASTGANAPTDATYWALMAQKGDTGATGPSIVTTKGDLASFSTALGRLPVGTNGQMLISNSGATFGINWSGPASSSLIFTTAGPSVALASNSGLNISSGLYVRGLQTPASDPASLADGDTWYNTTSQIPKIRRGGFTTSIPLILFSAGVGTAITNTTTEGDFGTVITIPANFLTTGRLIRMTAAGSYTYAGAAGTLVIGGRLGGAADGFTVAAANLASSGRWYIDQTFSVNGSGVTANVAEGGYMYIEYVASIQFIVLGQASGFATINTTTTNLAKVVASWSVANAGNSINTRWAKLEVIG